MSVSGYAVKASRFDAEGETKVLSDIVKAQ